MIRALVLAAGRGERLRPLTDTAPKPLLAVLGEPVLLRTLRRLASVDVGATAVNLHHLGEQIQARLGSEVDGMPLIYSPESELLGTLGPLARLRAFFVDADPVLLVNGDSLCDWPVEAVVDAHRSGNAAATLLISTTADTRRFGGGVSVDENGRVLSFRGEAPTGTSRRGVFAGLHALSPELLHGIVEEPSDIVRELYEPSLAGGAVIQTVFTELLWHDLGTPRRYLDGVLDAASSIGGGWRHEDSTVSELAAVEGSVLEAGVVVNKAAKVERALLLADSRIGPGSRIHDSIVGPGVEVPGGVEIEGLLLTAAMPGGPTVSTPL